MSETGAMWRGNAMCNYRLAGAREKDRRIAAYTLAVALVSNCKSRHVVVVHFITDACPFPNVFNEPEDSFFSFSEAEKAVLNYAQPHAHLHPAGPLELSWY
jgi:hypothetical protein